MRAIVMGVLLVAATAAAAKPPRFRTVEPVRDDFRSGMRGWAGFVQGVGVAAAEQGRPLIALTLLGVGTGGGMMLGRDAGAPKVTWRAAARHPLRTGAMVLATRPLLRRQLEIGTMTAGFSMLASGDLPGTLVFAGGGTAFTVDGATGRQQIFRADGADGAAGSNTKR